jgi:hypothetical protein
VVHPRRQSRRKVCTVVGALVGGPGGLRFQIETNRLDSQHLPNRQDSRRVPNRQDSQRFPSRLDSQ